MSACISLDAPVDDQALPPNIVAVDRAVRVLRALRPLPLQTGLVVAIGGRCVSAEVFDRPETLAGYWDEILAAIALDAPATRKACSTRARASASVKRVIRGTPAPGR